VEFIDHETHDAVFVLGTMPMQFRCRRQARKSSSVQLNSKLSFFDFQHFRHVAPDHPANLNADRLFLKLTGTHNGLLACRGMFSRENR